MVKAKNNELTCTISNAELSEMALKETQHKHKDQKSYRNKKKMSVNKLANKQLSSYLLVPTAGGSNTH